jgi:hypothetical protein
VQCAIPAFDGLFPELYNSSILKLLFLCNHWYGLAKLRSHTDPTLSVFDNVTVKTGAAFRHFANNICVDFDTRELAREEGQRKRREAKQKGRTPQDATADADPTSAAQPHANTLSARPSASPGMASLPTAHQPTLLPAAPEVLLASGPREETPHAAPPPAPEGNPAPSTCPKFSNGTGAACRIKKFTLNTYKYHACGDYPNTIRRYGTTDSYSTEIVSCSLSRVVRLTICLQGELEHKKPKTRYKRTDRKLFIKQITSIECRQARIRRIRERYSISCSKPVPRSPRGHHHVASSEDDWDHIGTFLIRHQGDPATCVRQFSK